MNEFIDILLNVLAPIFMLVGASAFIGRRFKLDPRGVSTLLIYLFVPALSFKTLIQLDIRGIEDIITGDFGRVFIHTAILMVGMTALGMALTTWLKTGRRVGSAFSLVISMPNAGNYGIPMCTFAFGSDGGAFALLFYVSSSIVVNSVGTFVASSGGMGFRQAAANIFRVPSIWGVIIALAMNILNIPLPQPLERSIFLAADATLPVMLSLLGFLLGQMDVRSLDVSWRLVALACVLRLVGGAVIGFILAGLLGFTGVLYAVAVLESAMPTAVMANALSAQFGSDTQFTSAVTLVSTLLSIGTMTLLIALLR
jgi:hypothetical protein